MEYQRPLQSIADDELLRRLTDLMGQSRRIEADVVAHIAEVDERRLYARAAAPSMFAYCTEILHLSESEAYLRIAAARASREYPILLAMLRDGRLHLTAIAKLAPQLTPDNAQVVLEQAAHRSKREIDELIADLAPRPDAPAVIRKLPERRVPPLAMEPPAAAVRELRPDGVAGEAPELRPDAVGRSGVRGQREVIHPRVFEPLSPARYKVQFTADASLHRKLERLRALMRSRVPDGDLAAIIEEAVTEKLERLEARRFASSTVRPRRDDRPRPRA